jgi:hypothetical protein
MIALSAYDNALIVITRTYHVHCGLTKNLATMLLSDFGNFGLLGGDNLPQALLQGLQHNKGNDHTRVRKTLHGVVGCWLTSTKDQIQSDMKPNSE